MFTLNGNGEIFKDAAFKMKECADKGYINKNPFANKVRSSDSITQGKSGLAFAVDPTNIKTEVANVSAVDVQYLNPIGVGAVKDVDAAIKK